MILTIPEYQVIEQIHEGSNSQVYRGIRIQDNYPVVIKVLRTEFPTIQTIGRYRLEYEITRSLNSDLLISAYDFKKYQNGFAIILEDFGGESLANYFASHNLDLLEIIKLAIKISEAVSQIHNANIIHKDINLSNIIFNPATKQLKIIDFGIASSLTQERLIADQNIDLLEGTLAYISPEQTGRMNRSLDFRSDIYSMGVTFYQMLTGRLPFISNEPLELIHHHLALEPSPPHFINSQIPLSLSRIISKMLAKIPEERYKSAWGVKSDLEKCLNQLETHGQINDFKLAQQDVFDKFLIAEKLYGRTREVESLLEAFSKITDSNTQGDRAEVVLVSGYSGIGKSKLVQEIYRPVTQNCGYFICGKFDQYQSNIPYLGFIQALQHLIKQLLTENEDVLNQWRSKIINILGTNSYLITQVIPDLEFIIGKQDSNLPLLTNESESQNRFNRVFQKFIRIFAQSKHPLVIFLDDLQWADRASLKLLQILATTTAQQSLLLIGAYRDNEVNATHHIKQMIANIQNENRNIREILLSAINLTDINQMIADTFHCSTHDALPLAKLIEQKTSGNPFFMNKFLGFLYDKHLIQFNYQLHKWEWSIDQIRDQKITDNVVGFVVEKIQALSDRSQYLLQIAACIGNQFNLDMLVLVAEISYEEAIQGLLSAIAEGLIFPLTDAHHSFSYGIALTSDRQPITYKFAHDRIQQAAYSLISEMGKSLLHYRIGKLLLEPTKSEINQEESSIVNLSELEQLEYQLKKQIQEQIQDQIFIIVNQLDLGIAQVTSQKERDYLAQLHLFAGRKARLSYAYESSVQYCETGMSLLNDDAWTEHYQLTRSLYLEAITSACLTGQFDLVDKCIDVINYYISVIQERVPFIEVQIQSLIARNRLPEAIAIALDVLQQLGVQLPAQPNQLVTQQAFQLVFQKLAATSDVMNLPAMQDSHKLAAMNILSNISSAAYISFPALYPLIVLKQIELSLEFGNTPETAYAFSTYGLIMCVGDDIEIGNQSADIALALMKKFDTTRFKAKIFNLVYHFIRPWQASARDSLSPLLEGYQAGMESGDLEFAAYCAFNYCQIAYFSGENLLKVKQDMATYGEAIAQLKQAIALNFHQIGQQAVLNWLGEAENPQMLIGEVYNETERLPLHLASGDTYSTATVYIQKLILSYHFGQPQEALAIAKLAEQYISGATGAIQFSLFYFYHALTLLANTELANAESEDIFNDLENNLENDLKNDLEKLINWTKYAPSNFAHRYNLVRAEMARVRGQRLEAMDLYDQAIASANENQYLHEEALSNELAAKFYLNQGKITIARAYMQEARYGYLQWGALAKVQYLESHYSEFLKTSSTDHKSSENVKNSIPIQSSSNNFQNLDLQSFLRSAQAISNEINLDQLLETLMNVLIENAGAQTGYLLLPLDLSTSANSLNQDQWRIEVIKNIHYEHTIVTSIPVDTVVIDGNYYIPLSVINYVIRTHENIVLNNATQVGDFQNDPWIVAYQSKSLLCMPLLNRGNLSAIALLENNLVANLFTSERLAVLNLLASHAAISISKARLLKQQFELNRSLQAEICDRQLAEVALKNSEATLQNLVIGTSAVTGEDFFPVTAKYIAEALNVKYALVTELIDDQLHSLGFWTNGVSQPPISYFPAQTPCEIALQNGEFICNSLLQQMFPEDLDLITMQADSYMGIALKNTDGNAIGNLCILDVKPIQDIPRARSILQVFAARASAELQRKNANEALYQLNQSLEVRVQQRTAQLEVANKELESFSYSVSHDLRAPLRAINGFSRILQEDYSDRLDSEAHHLIQVVRDNAKRMGQLIEDLLDLSRLTRKEMSRQSINMNNLIQQVLREFNSELESRQIEFVFADLPDCQADISLLTQVWINLLGNAIKYTSKIENARIEIGSQVISLAQIKGSSSLQVDQQSESKEIIYFIRDNGAGFDMQYADKLFGVFQRMHLDRDFEGTGIGLAIAHRIVQRHGGRIWAEAAVNQGATFYLTIPD